MLFSKIACRSTEKTGMGQSSYSLHHTHCLSLSPATHLTAVRLLNWTICRNPERIFVHNAKDELTSINVNTYQELCHCERLASSTHRCLVVFQAVHSVPASNESRTYYPCWTLRYRNDAGLHSSQFLNKNQSQLQAYDNKPSIVIPTRQRGSIQLILEQVPRNVIVVADEVLTSFMPVLHVASPIISHRTEICPVHSLSPAILFPSLCLKIIASDGKDDHHSVSCRLQVLRPNIPLVELKLWKMSKIAFIQLLTVKQTSHDISSFHTIDCTDEFLLCDNFIVFHVSNRL